MIFRTRLKASASDRVEYKHNRLGELKEIKDQIESVRVLEYDKLGRLAHDRVTVLGSGVDGTVRRISRSYEVRGMLSKLTSWNNATAGGGTVANEIARSRLPKIGLHQVLPTRNEGETSVRRSQGSSAPTNQLKTACPSTGSGRHLFGKSLEVGHSIPESDRSLPPPNYLAKIW